MKKQEKTLHRAADNKEYTLVKNLLEKGNNANELDKNGMTPLAYSVYRGDEKTARLLLTYGADPNAPSSHTPLQWAIQKKHADLIRMLVTYGSEINSSADGVPPLSNAAGDGNLAIVSLLLDLGADVNFNVNGTALHTACAYGHTAVAKELLSRGASVDAQNVYGQTPLFFAVASGKRRLIDLLIKYGAATEVTDNEGRTPEVFAKTAS